jgi:hypothetical protein
VRLYKALRHDISYGLILKPRKWLVALFFFAVLFVLFVFDVFHIFYFDVKGLGDINSLSLSLGDVIMFELGGSLPMMAFSVESAAQLPTAWLLAHILICYFTLYYLNDDLSHEGMQIIFRMRDKSLWWLSKVIWNIISVVLCYLVGYGILYVLCMLTGKNGGLSINPALFSFAFSEAFPNLPVSESTLFLCLCVLPCVVGITISLLQMALTLFVKPIFAYIASCVYFIGGSYYAHPLMISNYAMPVRGAAIGIYNFRFASGIWVCLIFCLAAIIVGSVRLNKMDIVNNA